MIVSKCSLAGSVLRSLSSASQELTDPQSSMDDTWSSHVSTACLECFRFNKTPTCSKLNKIITLFTYARSRTEVYSLIGILVTFLIKY